jgi:hypothetical protein
VDLTGFSVAGTVVGWSPGQSLWAGADPRATAPVGSALLARLWASDSTAVLDEFDRVGGLLPGSAARLRPTDNDTASPALLPDSAGRYGTLWNDSLFTVPAVDLGGWLDAVPLPAEAIDAALADAGSDWLADSEGE